MEFRDLGIYVSARSSQEEKVKKLAFVTKA